MRTTYGAELGLFVIDWENRTFKVHGMDGAPDGLTFGAAREIIAQHKGNPDVQVWSALLWTDGATPNLCCHDDLSYAAEEVGAEAELSDQPDEEADVDA